MVLGTACVTVARAEPAEPREPSSCDRPRIELLRYDEDWAFLRDPGCRTELWDPVKYIELASEPWIYLTLGADVRERFEYFRNRDWGAGPDDGYLLQRYMAHADLHLGSRARVFAQLTSNFENGRAGGPRPTDEDRLDLHQAFLDVRLELSRVGPLTLRVGRQEIDYEDARLISVREGANVRLSFDAVRVMQPIGDWRVDAFAAAPVETGVGVFDDGWEPGRRLWGVYAFGPIRADVFDLDLFYFGFDDREATFDQGTAHETRHSLGVRASGTPGGTDYNVELVYQLGSFGRGSIRAWTAASEAGYTFRGTRLRPRVGVQVNATSGDDDPRDPDLQTFNPLFPQASYFSDANLIGPINHIDVDPNLTLSPFEELAVLVRYNLFWRQSLEDGVYQTSGVLIASGQDSRSRHVGSEAAVRVQWQASQYATVVAAYSHFFTGSFLQDVGLDHDVDFFACWLWYRL